MGGLSLIIIIATMLTVITLLWFFPLQTVVGILAVAAIIILVDSAAEHGIFLARPPEGGVIVIMDGDSAESYAGFCPEHTVDKLTGEIVPNTDPRVVAGEIESHKTLLGMIWVGFYPFKTIHQRHFVWKKPFFNPTRFEDRDEWTRVLVWRYPYGIEVLIPAGDNVPLRVMLTVTMETSHAGKTLFGTRDFLVEATSAVHDVVRDMLGNFDYETIVESKNQHRIGNSTTEFSEEELVRKVSEKVGQEVNAFGQMVFSVRLLKVEVADPNHPIAVAAIAGLRQKIEARKAAEAEREGIPGAEARTRKAEESKRQLILIGEGEAAAAEAKGLAEAKILEAKLKAERGGLGVSGEAMLDLRRVEQASAALGNWPVENLWVTGGGKEGGIDPLKIINITPPGQRPSAEGEQPEEKKGEKE